MTEPRIRVVRAGDIPSITAVYAHHVLHGTASFELEPPGEDEMHRRMTALRDAGFPYRVAECGDTVAGYAYAGPYRTRPAYRFSVENSVYVSAEFARRGIGRMLLATLIGDCEAMGLRRMVAIIGDTANVASIELHRSLGFRHVGTIERVGFKFDRWLDSVIMQRDLGRA